MTLLLGTRKGLLVFVWRDGWRFVAEHFIGIPVAYATEDERTGFWWACLDHGHWGQKLHRSRNRGVSWEEMPAPAYPPGAEVRPGQPASVRYLWTLVPGGADQPERLYLGTEPGGLFRSDDSGASWQLVESLWNHASRPAAWFGGGREEAGIHSIVADPRDSRRVLVGVSCAGVFGTADDGATWVPQNRGLKANYLPDPEAEVGHDPHCVALCPAQPEVVWQQNHCGIFPSTDAGASWVEVSESNGPARFGFAIAPHPTDPLTAWVVPAVADENRVAVERALVVCRTRDGGQTWEPLRRGLPQEHCYDLILRHALDLAGERLVFGSTTGNVFTSNDSGDSWEMLGGHFPPVYSVRLARGF